MSEIIAITYAESREAFFTQKLKQAQRSLDNTVKYGTAPYACAEKGEAVEFYRNAIEALREKEDRENPKPLTLGQLQERTGKPIWISGIDQWAILGRKGIDADDDGNPIFRYVVGFVFGWEWLDDVLRGRAAYDYPPKEDKNV